MVVFAAPILCRSLRSGGLALDVAVFELRPVLTTLLKLHRAFASSPLLWRVAPAVPRWVATDPLRLQQVRRCCGQ
jgi:hypothetical protein